MVYLRLEKKEKQLISKLKTKYLQIGEDYYITFKCVEKAVEFLNKHDQAELNRILGEEGRIVFDRTVRDRRKVHSPGQLQTRVHSQAPRQNEANQTGNRLRQAHRREKLQADSPKEVQNQ